MLTDKKEFIDNKLCMLKSKFNKSYLKEKLENGTLSLKDLSESFEFKDFKNKEEKYDYYIVEASFFFHNKYINSDDILEDNLLVINRNVEGFDSKPRISKGLSFLFSMTPNLDETLIEQFIDKIKNELSFFGLSNEQLLEIDLQFIKRGQGFNRIKNKSNYIFFLYEIEMNKEIKDIFQIRKSKKRDIDFVFQVDGKFLYNTYKYFMNPKLHFDIVTMKALANQKEVSTHENAKFFKLKKPLITKNHIVLEKKNILENLKGYLMEKGSSFVKGIVNEMSENAANPEQMLAEIFRCLASFSVGAYRGLNKVI